MAFMLRSMKEEPQTFVSLACMAAAVFLYLDMRDFINSQTEVYTKIALQLQENNIRLAELENWHKIQSTQHFKSTVDKKKEND